MGGRITRVLVWALGTVLALSGLSWASTGGLASPTEESDAPATLTVEEPVVTSQSEDPPVLSTESSEEDPDGEGDPEKATVRSTEGCPEGFTGNHGRYVSSVERSGEARSAAAKSHCDKPVHPEEDESSGEGDEEPAEELSTSSKGSGHGEARRGPPEGKGPGRAAK